MINGDNEPSGDPKTELVRARARLQAEAAERRRLEEQLHSVSKQILQAEEAERRRIARELHDGVNQLLGSIRFRLLHLKSTAPAQAGTIGELAKLLDQAVQEVRRISQNLRPSQLDDLGLIPAVECLLNDFESRTQVRVDFQRETIKLAAEIELAVYRILQEAVANVEKHAKASHLRVALFADAKFVTLNVRDNGVGFLDGADNGGVGLINMRERTHALGGVFSIQSRAGHGTEVSVHLKREN